MKRDSERNVHSRHSRHDCNAPARNREIDLGLAVLCALFPGRQVPHRVIAEVTGLSHGGPFMIEQTALKKIRNRLRFGREAAVGRELWGDRRKLSASSNPQSV